MNKKTIMNKKQETFNTIKKHVKMKQKIVAAKNYLSICTFLIVFMRI